MKYLSLRRPYAELILQRRKTIELRNWNTRFREPLPIHSSDKVEKDACLHFRLGPELLPRRAVV